jgi:hypothetical protein
MVKKGWKQLSIHDSIWDRMTKQIEKMNRGKLDWEKKMSCNRYAELAILAQLDQDEQQIIIRSSRRRPVEIDTVAMG